MLKAIIFDIDETLIDWQGATEDWEAYDRKHLGFVFDYVEQNVHPLNSLEQFIADARDLYMEVWNSSKGSLAAPHLGDLMVELLARQGVQRENINAKDVLTAYRAEPFAGVVPFPEVKQELANLQRAGLRLGLATNAMQPMSMRDLELKSMGLLKYFEGGCRLSAADVGFLKPHPMIFETVLLCLGVNAGEAVFVGDSLAADIVGAQQVGMKAILRERLGGPLFVYDNGGVQVVPDGRITSLTEIYPLLDAWFPEWKDESKA